MKALSHALKLVFLCSAVGLGSVSTVAADREMCLAALPENMKGAIDRTYQEWRLLRGDDLGADDQGIWQRAFGDKCPSVVTGEFIPGSKLDIAVLLVHKTDKPRRVRVVVARELPAGKVALRTVLKSNVTNYPVIRKGPPGEYKAFYGEKKINVVTDVIVYEHLETRALALYYTKEGFKRLLVSD